MTLLQETAIFLAAAIVAVPLFRYLGFGSVLGYLAAGIVIGPDGFAWVADVDDVLHFAEIGVVLLLFIIGLELQPSRLWVLRHAVFGLGALQVAACALPLGLGAWALGVAPIPAALIGVGLALSSTAFVLQMLAERGQLTTHHGRAAFAILLFQDLAVVPLLAALPLLARGATQVSPGEIGLDALAVVGVLAGIAVGGRYLLRPVLRAVARTRTHEIFTATALLVVIGSALAAQSVGVSMGLGAFLAGVLLADSEYRHELEANIQPFKGLLLGLFFMAVGMSADLALLADRPAALAGVTVALVAVKAGAVYAVARALGLRAPVARHLALMLPQGGEFAFVLLSAGVAHGLLAPATSTLVIAAVMLSMALTPILVVLDERVLAPRLDPPPPAAPEFETIERGDAPVIIAGFGRFGQIVGRLLRMAGIPFTALEQDPVQVDFVRRYGNEAYYGDPSHPEVLRAAGIEQARAFVLAIDDVETSVRVAATVRQNHPEVPLYARARNRQHAHRLMELGAWAIVRETFDASLNLGTQLLQGLGWSPRAAGEAAQYFRAHDERTLEKQRSLRHDEQALIQSSREAAAELEQLFAYDVDRTGGAAGEDKG